MEKDERYYEQLNKLGMGASIPLDEEEKKRYISSKEQREKMPDVIYNGTTYCRVEEPASQQEFQRLYMVKSLELLKTIKNGVVLLATLAIIGVAAALIVPFLPLL